MADLAEDEVHQLLHQVDEEEAAADQQLRQTLQLQLPRARLQLLADLREDVKHGDAQHDAAAEAEEEGGHQLSSSSSHNLQSQDLPRYLLFLIQLQIPFHISTMIPHG